MSSLSEKNCPGKRRVVPSVSSEELQPVSSLTMERIPSKTRLRFWYQAEGLLLRKSCFNRPMNAFNLFIGCEVVRCGVRQLCLQELAHLLLKVKGKLPTSMGSHLSGTATMSNPL